VTACAHLDCPNTGTHHPVLLLRPLGYTGAPAEAVLGILVCPAHQEGKTAADFIVDEGWAQLQAVARAAGKAEADRASTGLVWKRPEGFQGVFRERPA
jgi:hypothetical protein